LLFCSFLFVQAIENKSKNFGREALGVADLFEVFTTPCFPGRESGAEKRLSAAPKAAPAP
jgi:hypothetical protein